jgi:excisionase family DNA binding protein
MGKFMNKMNQSIPMNERLNVSLPEACQLIGIGRTRLYDFINSGELRTLRIGGRRLVPMDAIRDFLAKAATHGFSEAC